MISSVVALFWLAAWGMGLILWIPGTFWRVEGFAALTTCVPIVFFSVQLPLWIVHNIFGWRIEKANRSVVKHRRAQMSIAGIMAAMFVVGTCLAIARSGFGVLAADAEIRADAAAFWASVAIACSIATGLSLITTVPLTMMTLRPSRIGIGINWALALWGVLVSGVLIWVYSAAAMGGPLPDFHVEFVLGVFCLVGGTIASIAGPLLALRLWNYRLLWGPE